MMRAVIAPTTSFPPYALAGKYVGATGDVSLGLGAGAKVLVGGSRRTGTLQPLSVEGQAGVNLALSVAGLPSGLHHSCREILQTGAATAQAFRLGRRLSLA